MICNDSVSNTKKLIDSVNDLDDSQLIMLKEIINLEINQRKREKIERLKKFNNSCFLINH